LTNFKYIIYNLDIAKFKDDEFKIFYKDNKFQIYYKDVEFQMFYKDN